MILPLPDALALPGPLVPEEVVCSVTSVVARLLSIVEAAAASIVKS